MSFPEGTSFENQVVGWLESIIGEFSGGGTGVCTNFVLIAEFMDAKGDWYTFSLYDQNSPIWRLRGLVEHELASIESEDSNEDEDEEDY